MGPIAIIVINIAIKNKTLWMILHQKTQVPNIRMIDKAKAHMIAYEIKKGQKVHWCMLAKWTIHD